MLVKPLSSHDALELRARSSSGRLMTLCFERTGCRRTSLRAFRTSSAYHKTLSRPAWPRTSRWTLSARTSRQPMPWGLREPLRSSSRVASYTTIATVLSLELSRKRSPRTSSLARNSSRSVRTEVCPIVLVDIADGSGQLECLARQVQYHVLVERVTIGRR